MTNILKDKYNFELRIGTKEEVSGLVEFLARKNWEDSKKNRKKSGSKTVKIEGDNFINKEKVLIFELIGDKVLVQDYQKFEVSIFTYNYTQEYDKNTVVTVNSRVLKTKKGMELLENEDVVFNLKELKKGTYHKKKDGSGRPRRPKNESIQKTLEIKRFVEKNPELSMDNVFQKFGFSKSTYYRVVKWLSPREHITTSI